VYARSLVNNPSSQSGFDLVGAHNFCAGTFATVRGLFGTGHSIAACTAGCANEDDCNYATVTTAGYCRYWSTCNLQYHEAARVFAKATTAALTSSNDMMQTSIAAPTAVVVGGAYLKRECDSACGFHPYYVHSITWSVSNAVLTLYLVHFLRSGRGCCCRGCRGSSTVAIDGRIRCG
jgi:hypothetical protein